MEQLCEQTLLLLSATIIYILKMLTVLRLIIVGLEYKLTVYHTISNRTVQTKVTVGYRIN